MSTIQNPCRAGFKSHQDDHVGGEQLDERTHLWKGSREGHGSTMEKNRWYRGGSSLVKMPAVCITQKVINHPFRQTMTVEITAATCPAAFFNSVNPLLILTHGRQRREIRAEKIQRNFVFPMNAVLRTCGGLPSVPSVKTLSSFGGRLLSNFTRQAAKEDPSTEHQPAIANWPSSMVHGCCALIVSCTRGKFAVALIAR